jgi:hypothetical protein
MAISNAEKQKRYRERQRAKAGAAPASASPATITSFAEYVYSDQYREEAFETAFDLLDLSRTRPVDDWIKSDEAISKIIDLVGNDHGGAIMAIATLAGLVSDYKVAQIDARIAEIEKSDVTSPALKEAADKYLAQLQEVRKQFHRKNRYQFSPMEVEGE